MSEFLGNVQGSTDFDLEPSTARLKGETSADNDQAPTTAADLMKIRAITVFITLTASDFEGQKCQASQKVERAARALQTMHDAFELAGYAVQTKRIATNNFSQWLLPELVDQNLQKLDRSLQRCSIDFCALGAAETIEQLDTCQLVIATSNRFSCSCHLKACDTELALACARLVQTISVTENGINNFRFCVSNAKGDIPFFPVARNDTFDLDHMFFAIALENGRLAQKLLGECQSAAKIATHFAPAYRDALLPIQSMCQRYAQMLDMIYRGVDTSLNPSLEADGSVARAMEMLTEVNVFGGHGSVAAAAAITTQIQTLPGVHTTGYCGLMLPLCEDERLAQLATQGHLQVSDLLMVSSVCGIGVDTVPLAGDTSVESLASLFLDVAGLAERWDKSLSCRVFLVPGKKAGDMTTFHSPYMVNTQVLSLE